MPYKATPTAIAEVLILEPNVFGDARGFFFESFNARDFEQVTGINVQFVQDNHRQFSVSAVFAHGFVLLSESADFLYKTTDYYAPEHERCIAWNDPTIGIQWPDLGVAPLLSAKDQAGKAMHNAEVFV